jgi:hypothetical protein
MAKSFTSLYDATEEIDLGDGFSVVVRRYLSEDDFTAAGRALVSKRQYRESGNTSEITGEFDAFAYNRTLVERALISWNLTRDNPNPDGEPLPILVSEYKARKYNLPQPVFRTVLQRVLELNKESEAPEEKVKSAKADADFRQ